MSAQNDASYVPVYHNIYSKVIDLGNSQNRDSSSKLTKLLRDYTGISWILSNFYGIHEIPGKKRKIFCEFSEQSSSLREYDIIKNSSQI